MQKDTTKSAGGKGGGKMGDENTLADQLIDRRGGFTIIEDYVIEMGLTPHELAVYTAIVYHASNKTMTAFPSYARIARLSSVSRRHAIRCVDALVGKYRLLAVSTNRIKDGSQTSNLYTIVRSGGDSQSLPPVTPSHSPSDSQSPELDSINKRRDIAGDKSPAKRTRPRNLYFDAIVTVFGYEATAITKTQASGIGKVAAELKDAGYAPEDVAGIYAHVKAQNYSSFTPAALSKHAADWKAKARPASTSRDRVVYEVDDSPAQVDEPARTPEEAARIRAERAALRQQIQGGAE